ncbi:MAPEG family protein [Acidomonas methanolica]|uniref:MAPEG family protein n=1 Tax=Acidomonas methanolica TaxID=437 RepID=UPI00211A233E|nr:MAPEG family protein [Acidomonas methanolica]MCQ9154164.1 MAPEG family protein [Acidomonas methanolica]
MSLSMKQGGTAKGMAAGGIISAAVIIIQYRFKFFIPSSFSFTDAVKFVCKWDTLLFICLLAAIARVATARFFSPQDIDGSGLTTPTKEVSIDRAVLQNTLEQITLAMGAYFSLISTRLENLYIIPALVLLFVSGRILFWFGYSKGAAHRACGFGMTFYPTVFSIILSVICFIF